MAPKSPTKTRQATPADTLPPVALHGDPYLYINRELSWLEFNHRVLEEAWRLGYRGWVGLEFTPRDGELEAARRVAAIDRFGT